MSNYKDLEKRRETQRKYREKNREKLRAYYNENYGAGYKRQWRDKKPDQRVVERVARRKYYSVNKEEEQRKSREYMRGYYLAHKDTPEYKANAKRKYEESKAAFRTYVATLKCVHCGEGDPDCLDFHHPVPKGSINGRRVEPPITSLITRKLETIKAQAEKCLVLCANCHRKEHARLRREQVAR